MYKPTCENPLLLVNRAALNYAKLGYKICGHCSSYITPYFLKHISIHSLIEYAKNHIDNLDYEYILLPNGHKEPLFCYVPCGHCVICRENKRNSLVFRAAMESACYNNPPFFITLTYDNAHLPTFITPETPETYFTTSKKSKTYHLYELNYKDVQDFFKRLRSRWDRKGLKHNIRYMVAGEYGKKTSRPHYHIIIWNNPYNTDELNPKLFNAFKNDVFLSWGKCQMSGFDFGQCAGGAASYAAKYVSKPCNMGNHHVKPFIHCSCGSGGIGYPLIIKKLSYLRNNPNVREINFRSFNGQLMNVLFNSYIVSKVWPSPSRLIPSKQRQMYKQLCDVVSQMYSFQFMPLEKCIEICNLLNPAPDIIPHQFKVSKKINMCVTARNYYGSRLLKIYWQLADELCEVLSYDAEYLEQYFIYKSYQGAKDYREIALKKYNILSKHATETDKELF